MECAAASRGVALARARCPQASLSRGASQARALRRLSRRCERPQRKVHIASASFEGGQGGRAQLDVASALKVLGLKDGAGFEDIVTAKNKILSQNPEMELQTLVRQREKTEKLPPKEGTTDAERPENRINKQLIRIRARLQSPEGPQAPEVDTAYDVLLMQSLTKRRSGVVTDSRVKFADVPRPVKLAPPPKQAQPPSWASVPLKSLPQVQVPEPSTALTQGAVFGVLALLSLAQGLTHQPGAADILPGTELAVGLGASIYFLRSNRNVSLGRAFALSMGGLATGAILGGVLQGWLRLDIVPLAGLSSPATLVSETALLGLFGACTLLL